MNKKYAQKCLLCPKKAKMWGGHVHVQEMTSSHSLIAGFCSDEHKRQADEIPKNKYPFRSKRGWRCYSKGCFGSRINFSKSRIARLNKSISSPDTN